MNSVHIPFTDTDFARLIEWTAAPYIAEAIVAGTIRRAGLQARLNKRNGPDVIVTLDDREVAVEVKLAWWGIEGDYTVVEHSPLRDSQTTDLVAICGRPDSGGFALDASGIQLVETPMLYLVPASVLRTLPDLSQTSQGRSTRHESGLAPYEVTVADPDRATIERLIAEAASR